MEKENVKKDEALKALQNQVSEETIKASMLILKKIFFLLIFFINRDIPVPFLVYSINCKNHLLKNE